MQGRKPDGSEKDTPIVLTELRYTLFSSFTTSMRKLGFSEAEIKYSFDEIYARNQNLQTREELDRELMDRKWRNFWR